MSPSPLPWRELMILILQLPASELDKPAGVWPPDACPEASFVPITGIDKTQDGRLVMTTGKKPT